MWRAGQCAGLRTSKPKNSGETRFTHACTCAHAWTFAFLTSLRARCPSSFVCHCGASCLCHLLAYAPAICHELAKHLDTTCLLGALVYRQDGSFQLRPHRSQQDDALVCALADILWQARIGPVAYVAAAAGEGGGTCASLGYDQLMRAVVLESADNKDRLQVRVCVYVRACVCTCVHPPALCWQQLAFMGTGMLHRVTAHTKTHAHTHTQTRKYTPTCVCTCLGA